MDLGGVISNLLSLGAKLLPAVVASAKAPSSSSSPPVDQNHQIEAELKKLMRMLERIKVTLYDAEQREITDSSVKLWLKELKGVAYDAEDVLGEYHYELLRAQVEARDASPPDSPKRMLNIIQVPYSMLDEIHKIRSRFDEIAKDRIALQLSEGDGPKHCKNELQIAPTSHFVVESNIFGREREKQKLIDLLSSECDVLSVVTIVGMGGIGKTTLAQLAYNDQGIRQRFDKFGWICVSKGFNVERLTKESLEFITGKECGLTNLSALQEKIRKEISGKRILLVLDDVWNENDDLWNSFKAPFISAAFAKILVTTRNDYVVRIMQTEATFNLGYLSPEQCWRLFKYYAFGGVEQNKGPKLIEIGKQIVNKCGMLPLAVKSIASLLRHEAEEESWRDILESELWQSDASNKIFPPLQISYARLPTYLKSCFLYCSMFPKDYKYNVGDLVKLWVYQGFIESKGNKTAEKIGFEYAQQLCQRSLFEREGRYEGNDVVCREFKLHDIVHDLARLNSENSCYSIEVSKLPNFPNVLYHLYVARSVNLIDPIPFDMFTALRTLIIGFSYKNFCSAFDLSMTPKLRVLEIRGPRHCELEYLSSVGNLKHLRYLSLSALFFETLPECICSLYNLQNLTLRDSDLKELPTKIGNLISLEELIIDKYYHLAVLPESICQLKSLRKLCINGCYKLKELPSDMGSLRNLQTLEIRDTGVSYLPSSLSKFVGIQTLKVDIKCETIGWLKDFPDLGGTLCLCGLKNVPNLMDVQYSNLVSMRNLEHLILAWDEGYYPYIDGSVIKLITKRGQNIFLEDPSCFSVMVSLQPHPNLSKLEIKDYSGITFPEWIGSLCKLKYLNITSCDSLQFLKAHSLPLELEELEIYGCHQLLTMLGIQKLKSLVKLSINTCENLCSIIEPTHKLTMCTREGPCGSPLLGLTNLASLRSLKITNCLKLQVLGDELLPVEACKVEVSDCPGLREWCLQHGINYKACLSSSLSTVNDDDGLSSTTETKFTVSPNIKVIKRRVKSAVRRHQSWMRGQQLGGGSFGTVYEEEFKRMIWVRGQELGSGSFGKVYEGISQEGFFFAVKEVLIDQGTNTQQCITHLEQEIALLSQFEHENIVQYYGTDKDETKLSIFLELVTQGSLASLYQKYHLKDMQVSAYTRQILYGLVYLHERHIVHRDIKCANILVHANGSVKLADFALAKKMTKINNLNETTGSVYWMAPEVVNPKKTYGPASDIWSLGCTVLEMLTHQIPYPNIEWTDAFFKIGRGEQPPIPNYLSREARDFITQCVRVNPDDRPSAVQLLEHPFVKDFLSSSFSTVNDNDEVYEEEVKRMIKYWVRGELLGRGSFGTVYEGISDEGFFFAVKEVLIDQGTNAQQSITQLEQEIALLSQFEHENIVQYYGTHKEETKLYIFLELVTQGSLASLYRKYHLRDMQVSAYTRQILYGLVYLHERNIVHGDIKCANILVHANGSVKLADFGFAKKMTRINNLNATKGSVYWMAPEVVNPIKAYGLEADIWSLGCTVLEMLTRQIPYPDVDWEHAFFKIGRGEQPPIPNYLSREAQDFITQCVRVNPDDRPSAVQLLEHPFVKDEYQRRLQEEEDLSETKEDEEDCWCP